MNWIKRLFCKKETRVINAINPNAVLANYLLRLIDQGKLKESYKGIEEFINNHLDVTQPLNLQLIKESTPEIDKLKKLFKTRHYKFNDDSLKHFIFD